MLRPLTTALTLLPLLLGGCPKKTRQGGDGPGGADARPAPIGPAYHAVAVTRGQTCAARAEEPVVDCFAPRLPHARAAVLLPDLVEALALDRERLCVLTVTTGASCFTADTFAPATARLEDGAFDALRLEGGVLCGRDVAGGWRCENGDAPAPQPSAVAAPADGLDGLRASLHDRVSTHGHGCGLTDGGGLVCWGEDDARLGPNPLGRTPRTDLAEDVTGLPLPEHWAALGLPLSGAEVLEASADRLALRMYGPFEGLVGRFAALAPGQPEEEAEQEEGWVLQVDHPRRPYAITVRRDPWEDEPGVVVELR